MIHITTFPSPGVLKQHASHASCRPIPLVTRGFRASLCECRNASAKRPTLTLFTATRSPVFAPQGFICTACVVCGEAWTKQMDMAYREASGTQMNDPRSCQLGSDSDSSHVRTCRVLLVSEWVRIQCLLLICRLLQARKAYKQRRG